MCTRRFQIQHVPNVIKLIVTVVLYATTPTLQGDWRSYGDIPFPEGQALCRKSNQWQVMRMLHASPRMTTMLMPGKDSLSVLATILVLGVRALRPISDSFDQRCTPLASADFSQRNSRVCTALRPHIRVMVLTCFRLPGTPLWLTALHSPAFSSVNPWFVPPMW